jgi:hypothetical protein
MPYKANTIGSSLGDENWDEIPYYKRSMKRKE